MANQTNFDKAVPERYRQAKQAVKDEYSFDFLELGEVPFEKELDITFLLYSDIGKRKKGLYETDWR